ncbi:C40 family peptidase [Streptomyces justiciae]|uniref:C40 family peptidase n=1 Tax=Streptomyces justiciae TaxID=2780140 RepID=UPI002118E384|nr:NlpC/P60 family protein [Streptomyces justiciae]MCW8376040.1 NlpC/P60 family protein [Streptomyces justiciae]
MSPEPLLSQSSGGASADGGEAPSRDEVRRRINNLYDRAESDTGTFNATRAAAIPRQRGAAGRGRSQEAAEPALRDLTRQWFDVARAKLGPTVPATQPAGRGPDRPERPSRPARAPQPARSVERAAEPLALEAPKAADRAASAPTGMSSPAQLAGRIAELTAGPAAEWTTGPARELTAGPDPVLAAGAVPELTPGPVPELAAGSAPKSTAGPVPPWNAGPVPEWNVGGSPESAAGAGTEWNGGPAPEWNAGGAPQSAAGPATEWNVGPVPELSAGSAAPFPPVEAVEAFGTRSEEDVWRTGPLPVLGDNGAQWPLPPEPTAFPAATTWPTAQDPLAGSYDAGPAVNVATPYGAAPATGPIAPYLTGVPTDPATSYATDWPTDTTTATFGAGLPSVAALPVIEPPVTEVPLAQPPAPQTPVTAPAFTGATGVSHTPKADRVIAFARAQIGRPCVWGAAGPGSFDAPGLSQAAWKVAGVTLPRTAQEQAGVGTPVALAEVEVGDLVFFHDDLSHVGIWTGNGMMIHAPGPGAAVREESVFFAGQSAIKGAIRPA